MADAPKASSSGGFEAFVMKVVLLLIVAVFGVLVFKFIHAEIKGVPMTFSSFEGLNLGGGSGAPASQQLPPPVRGATPAQCTRVSDAVQVANTVCSAGHVQFSWRGRSDYCLAPKPTANAYLCMNTQTNMLAWFKP